jgi:hypothetical protein
VALKALLVAQEVAVALASMVTLAQRVKVMQVVLLLAALAQAAAGALAQ